MQYQITANLVGPQCSQAVATLEKHNICATRDISTGRIACYDTQSEAEATLLILQTELPQIEWWIATVDETENE